jgi:NTE family protein
MSQHWESGLEDIRRSFKRRDWFVVPSYELGFLARDIHRAD